MLDINASCDNGPREDRKWFIKTENGWGGFAICTRL